MGSVVDSVEDEMNQRTWKIESADFYLVEFLAECN